MKRVRERSEPNPELRVTRIRAMQCNNDIIAMLLDGLPVKEVYSHICSKYRLKRSTVGTYISACRKIIKERKNYELDTLISLHIQRYEEIYAALYKIGAYTHAMNAMKSKEILLGMHKEGFHMKVSQGEISAIHLRSVSSDYDVKKLDDDGQQRFQVLLNKARR